MKSARLLVLSLLVTGCATTSAPSGPSAPTPQTLRSYESVDAPRVGPEPVASSDSPVFRLTALPSVVAAQTPAQESPSAGVPANRHRYGFGVGVRFRGGDSALDLQGQYQYWVNSRLEVGAIADWALSPIDTLLVAPAAWWHVNERLTLLGAPGLEFESGDGAALAMRLGASWRLMLEKMAIRPFGYYDFVEGRTGAWSIGIAIGV